MRRAWSARQSRASRPTKRARFSPEVADSRRYALIVVAVSCGLREKELLGLRWVDPDLERGLLRVARARPARHRLAARRAEV